MNLHPARTSRAARPLSAHSVRGFTLIELMIAVAVVAILAAIAYPAYTEHVVKSYRASAQSQMLDIANRQQQYFMANRTYASKTQLEASGYALDNELSSRYSYSITVGTSTVPNFTITFTATNRQASDGELTLDGTGRKLPAAKWTR